MQLFVAVLGNEVVGRIAAIRNDLFNAEHACKTGFFGFFESIDDRAVAHGLLDAAAEWLREQGSTRVHGPASPSSNHDYGLQVTGFEEPAKLLTVHNPPYYQDLVESWGLEHRMTLLAYRLQTSELFRNPKVTRVCERARARAHLTVRQIDMSNLTREIQILREIYNSAWKKNYGFVPLTDRELDEFVRDLRWLVEPSMGLFAEVNGEPVGFCLALPDYNAVLRGMNGRLLPLNFLKFWTRRKEIQWARAILLGVKPGFRSLGVDAVIMHDVMRAGEKIGYPYSEASWILEDNVPMNRTLELLNGEVYKRYFVYEKEI